MLLHANISSSHLQQSSLLVDHTCYKLVDHIYVIVKHEEYFTLLLVNAVETGHALKEQLTGIVITQLA
jgi:hypothetical protein